MNNSPESATTPASPTPSVWLVALVSLALLAWRPTPEELARWLPDSLARTTQQAMQDPAAREIPRPAETFGLDTSLPAALGGPHARADAQRLAHFAGALADYLEADGAQPQPHLAYVAQVFDAAQLGRTALFGPRTLTREYPELGPALEQAFARLGSAAERLDPPRRAQAVALWRAAAYGFSQVH